MADFHFIRPWWLLAIVALVYAIYLLKQLRVNQSGWQKLLPAHLTKVLVDGKSSGKPMSLTLPFVIGLLAITALAGPTWQKLPQPVYQMARGSVLIMDMSYSMYATDLTPNRLTRARYKAIDLLEQLNEGEIGLIAYAGDAFTISPLTEDINNIELLLPSLSPELMPELGSNPYAAFVLAEQMLKNAGHIDGDIYWFTDGIDQEDIQDIVDWSRDNNYRINILGIGTKAGAPIKLSNGQLLKDDSGSIVIPKLSEGLLETVASQASGQYARLAYNNSDVDHLLTEPVNDQQQQQSENAQTGDQWQEFGPYLLLVILPLMLGYFRRGAIAVFLPFVLLLTPSEKAHADFWQDLWKTKNQQGQALYNQEDYANAAKTFDDPMWQGSAHYKAGEYEKALAAFQQGNDAQALYNQGNALAQLQQIDQAIAAYEHALALAPDHSDAATNKALLEKMKEQQQQQQNQDKQNQDQQDQDSSEQQNQDQQGQDQQNQQDQQQSEQQQDQSQQDQQQSSDRQEQQSEQQQSEQEQQQNEQQEQQEKDAQQQEQESAEQEMQEQQAQTAQAQQDKETEQKHKQLLNKVTDDPYLLLRNKMQLEYQKRRQSRSSAGVKKKW